MKLDLEKIPTNEQIGQFFSSLAGNKKAILSLIVGAGAILALALGLMIYADMSTRKAAEAWDAYLDAADPAIDAATPSEMLTYVDKLQALARDHAGTSAEPFVLKEAADIAFSAGDVARATQIFNDIKARFPHHVLVTGIKHPMAYSDTIEEAIDDCKQQSEFLSQHTIPVPSPEETPEPEAAAPAGG
jgi:hypothetical protein